MGASSFRYLCLIPAEEIIESAKWVPAGPGVYYAFFNRGMDILRRASYFDYSAHAPLTHGTDAHLYTGSSCRMRERALAHLKGDANQSPLRKTLVALEFARAAISRTRTPNCAIRDKESLDAWLLANTHFAFIPCANARAQELRILRTVVSPLNIRSQRSTEFADRLLQFRAKFFPRGSRF